ncbi:MAG: FecR family protein [Alcaligenes nematophilus]|jgi:transmembrane sensor|uniref:FecR family protein n=1 Tax=Alcaligenes TaxID=507 RepID=UPI001EF0FE52|nr:FecR family protein [Alcaligenes faecalis]ULH05262.1 FecR family protein [Alcaligenes faecalis]
MSLSHSLPIPDDPHDAAAFWFARVRGGLMQEGDQTLLKQWREQDPRHAQAYQDMEAMWSIAQATPDAAFKARLAQNTRPRALQWGRRAFIAGLGSACAAIAGVAVLGPQRWLESEQYTQRYVSRKGERLEQTLPDGSLISLNTDSVVHVSFYQSERRVVLEKGEAFFQVRSEPDRPFNVDAGQAVIRVTGTRFNVRRETDTVDVAVDSGSVRVESGPWWNSTNYNLVGEQGVRLGSGQQASVQSRNMVQALAWRQGRAIFDAEPLEHIVAELNRYKEPGIVLHSPSLRGLRVTGVFDVNDPQAFLGVLPSLAPVVIVQGPDGRLGIAAR